MARFKYIIIRKTIFLLLSMVFLIFSILAIRYVILSITTRELEDPENGTDVDPSIMQEAVQLLVNMTQNQLTWVHILMKGCTEILYWNEVKKLLNETLRDYNKKFLGIKDENYLNDTIVGNLLSNGTLQFIMNNSTIVNNN